MSKFLLCVTIYEVMKFIRNRESSKVQPPSGKR